MKKLQVLQKLIQNTREIIPPDNLAYKLVILILVLVFLSCNVSAQRYSGIYVEVYKIKKEKIKSGQFFMNKDELKMLIKKPDTIWDYPFMQLVDLNSKTFERLQIVLPDSIHSYKELDSLYEVNCLGNNVDDICLTYQSKINSNYYFRFRYAVFELSYIGDVYEFNKISNSIMLIGCPDCSNFPYLNNYFIIKKIILDKYDIAKDVGILKLLKKVKHKYMKLN